MPSIALVGLENQFVHKVFARNVVPETGFGAQADTIRLVEGRTNEISVPIGVFSGVDALQMQWDSGTAAWVPNPGTRTKVSEFCKQINQRYLGSAALNATLVVRCETIDAETGNRYVFTPGATVVGSLQDFEVIIPDEGGGFESRGFTLQLATDANPSMAIDSGNVLIRLNQSGVLANWS
jgi:hypothetical protein